ncbi:hypothetical protein JW758_01985 [Candidatus Peregrinibacteria bacterium]|nr:hypothetical protein [Candidatus Peregrinibacteria bacterium]
MRDFNKGRGGGNFGNRGGGRGFGGGGGRSFGGDRGRPEMHRAVCDECGDQCEVPFKPSGDKPVLCNNCFKKDNKGGRGDRDRDRGRGRDFGGDRGRDRQMHKAVCADCGKNCEVPFKPSGDKPVLCSDCFGGGNSSGKPNQSSEKHDEILAKLDKILNLLQRTNSVKEVTVMKEKEEVKAEKKAEPKAEAKKAPAKKAEAKKPAVKKTPAKKKASTKKAPAKKK